jgi:hypothetical protein
MLTSLAIVGVLSATAIPHLDTHRQDIRTTMTQVISDYRWTRVRAITSGVHFALEWTTPNSYRIKRLKLDVPTGTWGLDVIVKEVTLPNTVMRSATQNTAEFNTRGLMIFPTSTIWQSFYDSHFGGYTMLGVYPSGQTYQTI